MAQNSWPFYSGSSGTPVLEDQWSIMARAFTQSGVVNYANKLEVYGDSSGRQVKVKTGRATVRGHWYENTSEVTVSIDANTSGNPRIDRVVLKLDPSADSIVLAVVKGTAAGSPTAPSLTQTDTAVFEMTLAQVAVANGASTITAGNVTDERTYTGSGLAPTWCQGTRASNQAFADITTATLTYTAETDANGMLNTSTGVVTIPTTGLWMMTLDVGWASDFAGFKDVQVRNTSTSAILAQDRNGDYIYRHNLSFLGPLTAGGTYDVRIYQDSTGSQNVSRAAWSWALLGTTL